MYKILNIDCLECITVRFYSTHVFRLDVINRMFHIVILHKMTSQ